MMKATRGGGSSGVFNNALKAWFDIMCTSSMIKTLYRSRAGAIATLPMMASRTLSTPVFDAASISITSIERPSAISLHEGQAVGSVNAHGVAVGLADLWQFRALAR